MYFPQSKRHLRFFSLHLSDAICYFVVCVAPSIHYSTRMEHIYFRSEKRNTLHACKFDCGGLVGKVLAYSFAIFWSSRKYLWVDRADKYVRLLLLSWTFGFEFFVTWEIHGWESGSGAKRWNHIIRGSGQNHHYWCHPAQKECTKCSFRVLILPIFNKLVIGALHMQLKVNTNVMHFVLGRMWFEPFFQQMWDCPSEPGLYGLEPVEL